MSVIVWDGKTLAADKQSTIGGTVFTVTKIKKIRGHLVGVVGNTDQVQELFRWFDGEEKEDKWPKFQEDPNTMSHLLVIEPPGRIWKYETRPIPFEVEQDFYAMGSGQDVAIGALTAGADAKRAVEIASQWEAECGQGVDVLELGDG